MNTQPMIKALSRVYKSPQAAMDAIIRMARDEELKDLSPAEKLHAILAGKLSPEEMKAVGAIMAQLASSKEESADEPEENEASEHDAYEDEPVAEDDEEPNAPNFKRSKNLSDMPKVGRTAMDAKAAKSFADRFPGAARITTYGVWACKPEHTPRPSQTLAQDADFHSRFPLARRIA